MNIEKSSEEPQEIKMEIEDKKPNVSNSSKLFGSVSTNCSNKLNENNISKNANIVNEMGSFIYKDDKNSIFSYSFKSGKDFVSCAGEYLDEIYTNLQLEEENQKIRPKSNYMNYQKDINPQMRAILIDWLDEVHESFGLKNETLFQTVIIIDLYLSYYKISRINLQLLGIASLLISCKLQEIYYPKIDKFIDITDNAYTKNQLLDMENEILKLLRFNIIFPSSNDFYCIIAKAFNFNELQFYLGKYFLESSLVNYELLKYSPSVIGVSCAYIVMKFCGIENYKILYQKDVIRYENPEKLIKNATREICSFVKNLSQSNLKSIKDKYSSTKYLNVAHYCEEN